MPVDFKRWLLKYKIPHVLIWIAVSFFLAALYYDYNRPLFVQLIPSFVLTALCFPSFYLAGNWLVPAFIYKRRFIQFFLSGLGLLLLSSLSDYLITQFIYHVITGIAMFPSAPYFLLIFNVIVLVTLISIALGVALKILTNRFQMEKRLREVEKEKISTELNFLRSQVNPHFLFNVMNTIYFQIDKENIQARASVEKLSEMLRYQLYECTSDKIDIGKELEYIKNYVAMQTLRMEKGTDIKLCIDEKLSGFFLAPLLLLPIIENSFKHISNFKNPKENKIHIILEHKNDDAFVINVSNTYDKSIKSKHLLQSGGLGMQNLQRRLTLLYPERHEFLINEQEQLFETILKINYDA
ncbi:MAG TPA: histidine kinase [Chitinophagaceae bacterium]|nr:histidine kinase [Chitinophagaceae bacterium]